MGGRWAGERRRKKNTHAGSVADDDGGRRVLDALAQVEALRPVSRRVDNALRTVGASERGVKGAVTDEVGLAGGVKLGSTSGSEVVGTERVGVRSDEGEVGGKRGRLLKLRYRRLDLLSSIGGGEALAVALKDVDL
jgi:hypothetical protein